MWHCIYFHAWLTQYSVSPFLIRIMSARYPRRAGYICRELIPFIQYSMSQITDNPWMLFIVLIASPKFVPLYSMGVAVCKFADWSILTMPYCGRTTVTALAQWRVALSFWWRVVLQEHDGVIKWKYFLIYWSVVREFTGHRWIPRTKASDADLWCFLWAAPEPTVEQTVETPVVWDSIALIMTLLYWG